MYDPVVHHILRAYPAAAVVKEPLFKPSASLRCADKGKWQYITHADFALVYCQHDGADTFVSVLEIHARVPLEFPVECTHHDLHGCYLELGELIVSQGDDMLTLHTGQYAPVYAPKGDYRVRIEAGVTVLHLWSTNNRTLKRDRANKALSPLGTLLDLWTDKGTRCHHGRVLPFSGECMNIWDQISILPHLRPLTMDNRLRELITDLVYCCIDALKDNREDGNRSLTLVHKVRARAIELVRAGVVPKVLELAAEQGTSDSYLRRVHRKHYHTSPQAFIMGLRLRKARELIIGDRYSKQYTYTQIAYAVGFTCIQDLNKQYKKLFKHFPHETNDL